MTFERVGIVASNVPEARDSAVRLRARYGDDVKLKPVGDERGWFRRRFRLAGPAPADWASDLLWAIETRAWWGRYGL